jgi:ribosomal protein L7Ae-like RNA K-turn-binding protein
MNKHKNDEQDPFLTALGLAKHAGKLIIGQDRIDDWSGGLQVIFVSSDASARTKKNAGMKTDAVLTKYTMAELGHAVGITKAAVIAVTDTGFVSLLKRKLTEYQS